jgi:ornithine cyclodeaminase
LIILKAEEIQAALPMDEAVEAMKSAYAALSSGDAQVPLRTHLSIPPKNAANLVMPAYIRNMDGGVLAIKAVSIFPENQDLGLPLIHAAVLVLDAQTGRLIALIEGGSLTAIRTGAASGAATDLLAREDSKIVTVFGAGVQARTQLQAVCEVRTIREGWISDPNTDKVHAFIEELAGIGPIPQSLHLAADPAEAANMADIICTATTSMTPVYPADAVKPGTHINGVGSYTLDMVENPPELLGNSRVFVDSVQAVMAEAGEIIEAINRNILKSQPLIELGDVVRGIVQGRQSPDQITFFKSVGVAVQDAVAANLAFRNAVDRELGQKVSW